ncbi:hypothetical protein [Amycolatopsis sp. WAC 01416]|uniref:CdiA C-terminal domain-containing protein n=1 Tax=Amycolatopsis sp. WAC 01416 TaxID=2203196 RepID=UPI0013151FF8
MTTRGRNVELRDPVGARAGGGTSDLVVDGVRWDVYSPTSKSVDRIIAAVARKHSQVHGGGVIVDLSRTGLTASDFPDAITRINGLIGSWPGNRTEINGIVFFGG